jgi:hypothetical protein
VQVAVLERATTLPRQLPFTTAAAGQFCDAALP